ncbi:MAG TPA: MucB/RseB C-terminal domain-containing protein [Arenimonas sp.]|uniref:MucB/RseB C-terminal domain-containing protein n=1 Tax=Arenimonas sp. TaxID=1872635 RepID=UPI002D80D8A3|nr:MucB/RseB C-terminal domain-containing protein [Arenimonas sp.]HEU0151737.1 MucB/RseB C-terminal domain-containing protein [Arenimonas sp.]
MRAVWLALLLALAAPLQAAVGATDWLARIGPALRGLDYQGTLVYVAGGRMETVRVFHRRDGDRERERLVTLAGPRREVIRDGSKVMCLGGDGPLAFDVGMPGRWSPALALSDAGDLPGYRVHLAGSDRVAGHAAQRIDIVAADAWRYGYRLWLERDTGLPLRVDLVDAAGEAVEQVAFTELSLDQRPSDADLAPSSAEGLVPLAPQVAGRTVTPDWHVPVPPPGFALRSARRDDAGLQLLYSDGLASVSVYVERADPRLRGASSTRRGAVHAHGFRVDGWHVLAIGKVPAATVAQLARTVRAVDADG